MKRNVVVAVLAGLLAVASQAQKPTLSEICVDLKMDERDYVSGERVRAVVDVKNLSPRVEQCLISVLPLLSLREKLLSNVFVITT